MGIHPSDIRIWFIQSGVTWFLYPFEFSIISKKEILKLENFKLLNMVYQKLVHHCDWISEFTILDLVYILRHNNEIVNEQLVIMWKRKLNFLSGYLLDPISKINKLIPGGEIYSLEHLYSKRVRNIDNLLEKCQPLEFTVGEEIYGKKMLNKFGLQDKDKFVCLSVRDKAYQLKKIPAQA